MRLVLLRHATAEDRYIFHVSSNGAPESRRPLSREGIDKMKNSASGLYLSLNSDVQRVVTSPYTRARQTADLFVQAIPEHQRPEVEISDLLTPGCSVRTIRKWLANAAGTIVLVGHEPDMSWLMSQFTGESFKGKNIDTGGACCIEFENSLNNSLGRLLWLKGSEDLHQQSAA